MRPIAMELLRLVWQAVILYVVVLFVVRLMGKRSVGKLAPFDLAVIIMIGELVAIPVTEERELYHGLIPVVVLGLLQLLLTWANTKSRTLERITQGTSTLLVKDGQPQMQGLTRERVTLEDLAIALREKEVENLADVKEAYLEPTGQISVLKQKDAQPVTPRDAQLLTLQRLDQVEPGSKATRWRKPLIHKGRAGFAKKWGSTIVHVETLESRFVCVRCSL